MKAIILTAVVAALFGSYDAKAFGSDCPSSNYFRAPEQVMEDHRRALADQDWEAVACNYARHARVISDQGVTIGRDDIVADLQAFSALFGGAQPTVTEQVITLDMVRVLFELDLGFAQINDGVDTYIIIFGQIHRQTAHGSLVFVPPSETSP